MAKKFDITTLLINPKNPFPFEGSDEEWNQFKEQLNKNLVFLEANKIAFDSTNDNLIIAGNKRTKALIELGHTKIDSKYVIDCSKWSEAERNEYIYASNVNLGTWSVEFAEPEMVEEYGIEFAEVEEEKHLEAEEDDFDTTPPTVAKTVLGDLYEIGEHRLLCGDSTDSDSVEKLMNVEKADMVFTDPPHEIEQEDFISYLDLFCTGVKFVMHNDKYLSKLAAQYIDRFERFFVHDFIFHIGGGNRFFTQNDLIACFDYNSDIYQNLNDGFSTVIRKMTERQKGTKTLEHPHKKPIYLLEQIVSHFSEEKQSILDLYQGSGTTMVAAHQLKRKCYGMELDEKYCDVIIRRMKKLDPTLVIKRNGKDISNDKWLNG